MRLAMKMKLGWLLAIATLAIGCGDNKDVPGGDAAVDGNGQSKIGRGQYIMNTLAACTFCHTPLLENGSRDLDKLFSGVDCFADIDSANFIDNHNNFGCISTRNLTPHETGLK